MGGGGKCVSVCVCATVKYPLRAESAAALLAAGLYGKAVG